MEKNIGIILQIPGQRVKRLTVAEVYNRQGRRTSISDLELALEGPSIPTCLIMEHGLQSLTPDRIIVRLKVEALNCQL